VERHCCYERYILDEVVPFMRSENGSSALIAHGCSIGAYHAATLAFRHPGLFCKLVALSGRYDLTRSFGPFEDLFSGHYDDDVYFITPNHFLPNLHEHSTLEAIRRMEITLAVGEQDPFHESNRVLSNTLSDKGIRHQLAVWPGEAHRGRYWREMVPHYL
jgi:esterase/lipase superfamily enzyme